MGQNPVLPFSMSHAEKILFIKNLVDRGGPEMDDYEVFTSVINSLEKEEIEELRQVLLPMLNENTLIGYGFKKPFGYPGDFNLINSIYKFEINQDPRFMKWDLFFQNQPGAMAVRNRKEYFLNFCANLLKNKGRELKVLILGSGPGTDVYEFLENYYDRRINFDLVDFDQNAIDFSKEKNEKFNGAVSYNRINVLRFKPYKLYDLIWSAGLFDYFKDKHFVFLIRKYLDFLTPGGEYIISNFSTTNPTKRLMEVLSDWYLNYRSPEDLKNIAEMAGLNEGMVKIDTEPVGVNLFLRLRKEGF